MLRRHRVVESSLVDVMGMDWSEVHTDAEVLEHAVSDRLIERMDQMLDRPAFDPHGDPIPTREGALPPAAGTPATSWPADALGRVVHLEDEPEISFAQIVAAGLRIGQVLRIIDSTPERIVMSDGEHEYTLAPAVAANVFLAPAPDAALASDVMRLSDLEQSRGGRVVGLDDACQGFSRRRLMDLGFTEGARIRPSLTTFAGDPRAYEVRGTLVALRRDQAAQILVRPDDSLEAAS